MTANRIKILDALRGLAALIVLFHHFVVFNGDKIKTVINLPLWKIVNYLSDLNGEAVLFFFIISGFCIGLAQKGNAPSNKTEIKIYFLKRLKRILPVYILALFITFLSGIILKKLNIDANYDITNFAGNLLFLQTPSSTSHWFTPYGNNGPLWSLSYEMFFYAFYVLFSFLLIKLSVNKPLQISRLLILFTLGAIACNHYILFMPWLSFLSLFIIWYYGYIIFQSYSQNKIEDKLFTAVFILTTIIYINKSLVKSDTLLMVTKGLLLSSILYFMLRIRNITNFKKYWIKIESVLVFLFYFVGQGSYFLYVIHYIILMLCSFFGLNLTETIIAMIFTIIMCTKLEQLLLGLLLKTKN